MKLSIGVSTARVILAALVLVLSACGGTSTEDDSLVAASALPTNAEGNPVPAVTQVPGSGDLGTEQGSNSTDPSFVLPGVTGSEISTSRINGQVTLLNDTGSTGVVNVKVRGTDLTAVMQENGEFAIDLPAEQTERTVVLDISGELIVKQSVSVVIPASEPEVSASAIVTASAAPIPFILEAGGDLRSETSRTRTTVTVPPNAFVLPDGNIATGVAEVRITDIDLLDLDGNSGWAPDLDGLSAEGEAVTLISYGMADFSFFQDGQELQLREGAEATLRMDLPITPEGEAYPTRVMEGKVIPLWYYDEIDMIWKEEGEAVVVADNNSASGYSWVGNVSHFTVWNADQVSGNATLTVNVCVKDPDGSIISGYPLSGWSVSATASNIRNMSRSASMTPSSNSMSLPTLRPQTVIVRDQSGAYQFEDLNANGTRDYNEPWITETVERTADYSVIVSNITSQGSVLSSTQHTASYSVLDGDSETFNICIVVSGGIPVPDPDPPVTQPPVTTTETASLTVNIRVKDQFGVTVPNYPISKFSVKATSYNPSASYNMLMTSSGSSMELAARSESTRLKVTNGSYTYTDSNNNGIRDWNDPDEDDEPWHRENYWPSATYYVTVSNIYSGGINIGPGPYNRSVSVIADDSKSITVDVTVQINPEPTDVFVNVNIVDTEGNPVDVIIDSYGIKAVGGGTTAYTSLTPSSNRARLLANTNYLVAVGRGFNTTVTVSDLWVSLGLTGQEQSVDINVDPQSVTRNFHVNGSVASRTINMTFVIDLEGRSRE